MTEFKVDEFIRDPDIDVLESLNKDQLLELGEN